MKDINTETNRLLAGTLADILNNRLESAGAGKGMISLEGFNKEVFGFVKDDLQDKADVYWSSDVSGFQLIRQRNVTDNSRHLVIFIDSYFAESQSLAHFCRITDQYILTDTQNLNLLVGHAFPGQSEDGINLLTEAVEALVACIEPSLVNLAEFLVESNPQEITTEELHKNFGKALWRLGLFSYETLIEDHIRKDYSTEERFKRSLQYSLNFNKNYANPGNRSRFTSDGVMAGNVGAEVKSVLLDYARGKDKENCLKSIDFKTVKDEIFKSKSRKKNKPDLELEESEENDEPILLTIARGFESCGDFEFQLGELSPFTIHIDTIAEKDLLAPIPHYDVFYQKWKEYNQLRTRHDQDASGTKDKNADSSAHHRITISKEKKTVSKEPQEMKPMVPLESKNYWLDDLEKIKSKDFKAVVDCFVSQRETIGHALQAQGALTLHLDIKTYIDSYLRVLKGIWENAETWAQQDGYFDVLAKFILLDLAENENKDLEILPIHPFRVFVQRLTEVLSIELIGNGTLFSNREGEPITFYNDVLKDLQKQFQKTFPLYLLRDKQTPPFVRDVTDDGNGQLIYKARSNFSHPKANLPAILKEQVELYVGQYPSAKHKLALKVINPRDGKDLFTAIKRLYDRSKSQQLLEAVSVETIGPENANTMSHFDEQAELREKDRGEMFLRQTGNIVPFCHYEKRMVKGDWLDDWQKGIHDDTTLDADICVALDPFFEKNEIIDKVMPSEIKSAVNNYFKELEGENFDPFGFITGPDRIYLRYALEALSIMSAYKGAEARGFSERMKQSKDYVALIKKMAKTGNWTMLMDHTINDFYAERIVQTIESELNVPASFSVQDSPTGVSYLFIKPSKSGEGKEVWGDRYKYIGDEFLHWVNTQYRRFAEKDEFQTQFLEHDQQWMIPLDAFPDWFKADTVTFKEQADDLQEGNNYGPYILKLLFNEEADGSIGIHAEIIYFGKAKDQESHDIEFDLTFLTEPHDLKVSQTPVLNMLKRRVLFDTMRGLLINPYQAWFLSLMYRRQVKFIKNDGITLKPKPASKNKRIGKLKLWHLRRLVVHFIKLYSTRPGLNQEERLILMSFFDDLDKYWPVFFQGFLKHLARINPLFFEQNPSFELYKKQ